MVYGECRVVSKNMQISDILSTDRVLCNTSIASKKAAIEALSELIADANPNISQKEVFESLWNRERLGSTGLDQGVAIPHGRLKNGSPTIAAFIQLSTGVDYDAPDKQPVDLMFALLVPENSTYEHLQTLARLAKMFSQNELLEQLRSENSNESIYSLLTS